MVCAVLLFPQWRETIKTHAVAWQALVNGTLVIDDRFEKPTKDGQSIFGTLTHSVTGMVISSSVLTISDPLSCQLF